jgi:hypothetical protein
MIPITNGVGIQRKRARGGRTGYFILPDDMQTFCGILWDRVPEKAKETHRLCKNCERLATEFVKELKKELHNIGG